MMLGFLCTEFSGQARGLEGQNVAWVTIPELQSGKYKCTEVLHPFLDWLIKELGASGGSAGERSQAPEQAPEQQVGAGRDAEAKRAADSVERSGFRDDKVYDT